MQKAFSVILIITLLSGCVRKNASDTGTWRIVECSHENSFLKKGAEIAFHTGNITVTSNAAMLTFPALLSGTRLVINTGTEKMLFNIDITSDTVWILAELYCNDPLTITLNKTNTKTNRL